MHGKYGHHGWHQHPFHRGWHGRGPRGLFFLPLMFLGFFLFFNVLKFVWPLLLIGLVIMAFKFMSHNGRWNWNREQWRDWSDQWKRDWDDKPKNDWDNKPKNDDEPRTFRRINGQDVEII